MPGMEDIAQLLQSLLSADNKGTEETTGEDIENERQEAENTGTGLGGFEALSGLFGGGGDSGGLGIDFDMLMKIGMLFAQFQKPDKNAALLIALKPMMRSENQEKIETALKLVKIMGLLPYLRESGFLDKLF